MRIELIYEHSCPNIQLAREQLTKAFQELTLKPEWLEWDIADDKAPDYVHGYGSPTILVNGKDVSAMTTEGHDYCCRVYQDSNGNNSGVPALHKITEAIQHATAENESI